MASNTFIAANGLLLFDWFDAANWSAGLPVGGQDITLNYAPGFAYTIQMGSTALGVSQNTPVTVGTLTLNSPNVTLSYSTTLTYNTIDLKAGTLSNGGNSLGLTFLIDDTIIAEGGGINTQNAPVFFNTTWLGDLSVIPGNRIGDAEFYGSTSFGPAPGGARPVWTIGNGTLAAGANLGAELIFRGTEDITGVDIVARGGGAFGFLTGDGKGPGVGTLEADVSFTAPAGSTTFWADVLTNRGRIVANGGTVAMLPFPRKEVDQSAQTYLNDGTIDVSNTGSIVIGAQIGGTGTIRIGSGGAFQANYGIGSGQTIDMLDASATLSLNSQFIDANLVGFHQGDAITMFDFAPTATSMSYAAGILKVVMDQRVLQIYLGTGYDPASFAISSNGTLQGQVTITTSTVLAPAFVPIVLPAPSAGVPGITSFNATNGRFLFDWNDATNWTEGVPAGAASAAITYAPGFAYQITAGDAHHNSSNNPLVSFGNLTLDSPNATMVFDAYANFGTLDLKAGRLSAPGGVRALEAGTPSPSISGTIIADGGLFDPGTSTFHAVTWMGDLDLSDAKTGHSYSVNINPGGLVMLPKPGGGRPVITAGGASTNDGTNLSVIYLPGTQTLTGVDIHLVGDGPAFMNSARLLSAYNPINGY